MVSIARATAQLRSVDKTMDRVVERIGPARLRSPDPNGPFAALVRSICFQQLAGAAASTIHGRFEDLVGGKVTPRRVLKLSPEALRGAGLSAAKARSVADLARHVADGSIPAGRLSELDDEEIIERLTVVWGIGVWTVQMFLMFELGRLDVWPIKDLGVQKGYARAYRRRELPSEADLDRLGRKFRPYRSLAAWYFWQVADA